MSHNYKSKIDSLLDNDSDISSPQAQAGAVTNHSGESYARVLLLVFADGNEKFLHYSYLIDADFQVDTGSILLTFTSHVVTLRGLRLHPLFRDLSKHLPNIVTIVDERYGSLTDTNSPVVTTIEIVEK
jgi:hypothetical protein